MIISNPPDLLFSVRFVEERRGLSQTWLVDLVSAHWRLRRADRAETLSAPSGRALCTARETVRTAPPPPPSFSTSFNLIRQFY